MVVCPHLANERAPSCIQVTAAAQVGGTKSGSRPTGVKSKSVHRGYTETMGEKPMLYDFYMFFI